MSIRVVMLVALTMALGSCASSGTTPRSSRSVKVITSEELETVEELNGYEAVQRLRPNWLRMRGRVSMEMQQGVQLYIDGVHRGYVAELVSIRANAIERMEFLSSTQATSRYGTNHVDGAVLVRMRR
jgi:hypothetical protein